jgi:mevalonate kinase
LTRSGILYEALKYLSAFFHYFIRDADRQLLHESLNSVVNDKPEELSKNIDEIMQLKSYLTKLSDSELEQLAQKSLDLGMKSDKKNIHATLYRLFIILKMIK